MKGAAIGFGAGVLVGALAAGLVLGRGATDAGDAARSVDPATGPRAGEAASVGDASVEARHLRAELALEREMRERLAEELARATTEGVDREESPPGSGVSPDVDAHAGVPGAGPGHGASPKGGWFDAARLESLGFDPGRIEHIRAGWEAYTMEKLYLADAQARGEQLNKNELVLRHQQIELRLREELGDADYEAVLYATTQRNRIVLTDVLEASPAGRAGIEAGDELISYDGQRVFQPVMLKLMTFSGEEGELAELRVLRDGELYRVFVPRGPLGVRFSAESRPPYLE